jgi:hypothetical protein
LIPKFLAEQAGVIFAGTGTCCSFDTIHRTKNKGGSDETAECCGSGDLCGKRTAGVGTGGADCGGSRPRRGKRDLNPKFVGPDKVTFVYAYDHEFRQVRLNQPHPALLTPSWFGDAVGHYDGDTLVIDTIGTKVGPSSMVDHFGTPYTAALHVIERYRLIDYDTAKEALARDAKENFRFNPAGNDQGVIVDPTYRGTYLQLQLTVEDEGVFTTPWSATITYRPATSTSSISFPEFVCAENPNELTRHAAMPVAEKLDF